MTYETTSIQSPVTMDLREAWQRYLRGDAAGFTAVYDALVPKLHAYVTAIVLQPAVAEDVIHDVFARLVRQPERLLAAESIPAYVYQACRNAALDWLRGGARRLTAAMPLDDALLFIAAPDADTALSDERRRALERAFAALDDGDRETLALHVWSGMTFESIGRLRGLTSHQARYQYEKAVAKCKALLSREEKSA